MLRGFLADLINGLTRPSVPAASIAFAVAALFLALLLVLPPRLMASSAHKYFVIDHLDRETIVTSKVLANSPMQTPAVVVLGSSVIDHCLVSDKHLEELLAAKNVDHHAVMSLITGGQSTWEVEAILGRLQPPEGSTIVLGLSVGILLSSIHGDDFRALEYQIRWPKLGFTSEALDETAREAGVEIEPRSGIWSLDNMNFLLARRRWIARNLASGPPEHVDAMDMPWLAEVDTPDHRRKEVGDLRRIRETYLDTVAVAYESLARAVARVRKNGEVKVIVVEGPTNPAWYELPDGADFFLGRFKADMEAFAKSIDARFLPATEAAKLKSEDFADLEGHIKHPAARETCTATLADRIARE